MAAVDDHPVALHNLRQMLQESPHNIELVASAGSVAALLAGPGRHADVVLLDLLLPEEPDVVANIGRLQAAGPRVVIFTSDSRPAVVRSAIEAGALALVLKGDPESRMTEAILTAQTGEFSVSSRLAHAIVTDPAVATRLSADEQEVLTMVAHGLPHKLIARRLGIAADMITPHLRRIVRGYARR
ncbi:DNA-binding NarL/FixJ family response regulator [Kibdelosporangium banguiense]|uniref:DNA-binding NarL/FixJ family response regulator n=1 Tax=Kibdelosporangium banguiense TaxID=1365924 RepID=A0ABS4TKA1_9PSEU|nr:response regulator [Kibdelosporangium banguiense]MBP2324857.1 DNA-binding NarL/FixJ family response regulator [Kibdelosporangium banguiense]